MEDLLGDFGGPRWFGPDLDFPQRIFWGLMVVAFGRIDDECNGNLDEITT